MEKKLKRVNQKVYYIKAGIKIIGVPDCISGDLSDIRGDLTGISGDLTDISGDLSGIRGNLTDCNISDKERVKGIRIEDLIGETA